MKQCLAVLASVIALVGCGSSGPQQTVTAVHVTRTPGLVVLPPIDQAITDPIMANRLAADVQALPALPTGPMLCPADYGTTYTLGFNRVNGGSWSAVVEVLGCQAVKLSDGRTLWARNATKLFADLGAALGLAPDELIPRPCVAALPGARCYPQPTPPNA